MELSLSSDAKESFRNTGKLQLTPLKAEGKVQVEKLKLQRLSPYYQDTPCYRAFPTRALGHLLALMRIVDDELPRITPPVLVLHGAHDHTAPVACAPRIAARARARRLRILPRSYHVIAADVERDIVAAEVASFVRRAAAEPAAPPSPPPPRS